MADLDSNLIAKTNLANQAPTEYTGFDLRTLMERGAVTIAKIRDFSFSSGSGGTITLGGTLNGNGLLVVENSVGGTVVTLNNNGLAITNGSISITNSSGGTVVDSGGIVSTVNFPNAQIVVHPAFTTISTGTVLVSGCTMNSFVLSRPTNVLVTSLTSAYNGGFDFNNYSLTMTVNDSVNGNIISYPLYSSWSLNNIDFVGGGWTTTANDQVSSISAIINMSAGTHVIKLLTNANGGGTVHVDTVILNYIILGS